MTAEYKLQAKFQGTNMTIIAATIRIEATIYFDAATMVVMEGSMPARLAEGAPDEATVTKITEEWEAVTRQVGDLISEVGADGVINWEKIGIEADWVPMSQKLAEAIFAEYDVATNREVRVMMRGGAKDPGKAHIEIAAGSKTAKIPLPKTIDKAAAALSVIELIERTYRDGARQHLPPSETKRLIESTVATASLTSKIALASYGLAMAGLAGPPGVVSGSLVFLGTMVSAVSTYLDDLQRIQDEQTQLPEERIRIERETHRVPKGTHAIADPGYLGGAKDTLVA